MTNPDPVPTRQSSADSQNRDDVRVRRIDRSEAGKATATLAEAFGDDPLLCIVEPDPVKRRRLAPWFLGRTVEYGLRWGQVWANDDASAVAVWLPPESGPVSPGRLLRSGMASLPWKSSIAGARRFLEVGSALAPFHESVHGPHWYLFTIGVRSDRRGQGLGSELIAVGTSRADAAGVACYLETGTQSNIDLYSSHGFEVAGSVERDGFTLTAMIRSPR